MKSMKKLLPSRTAADVSAAGISRRRHGARADRRLESHETS
jgi:hypothetical protein